MTSPAPAPASQTCPACQSPASGKYCSSCGAPLAGARCVTCDAELTPGAKFCHRCGTPANATSDVRPVPTPDRGFGSALPWAVAAIALVALVALVAGQHFSRSTSIASASDLPGAALPSNAAPDISQMTPEERAQRLYDRIMSLNDRGKIDSVRFFAPMAMQAFSLLGPLSAEQRYDIGRIGAVAGDEQITEAQSDTILATQPRHLLGLLLGADAARLRGDRAAEATYLRRFTDAASAERAKQLPEYQRHTAEIEARLGRSTSR